MRRKVFIALLALCSTNVLSCNVIAEYAIETSDNVHKLNYRQNMNLDKPEELFDAIIDSVSVIHSRSISRDRENDDILYFLSAISTYSFSILLQNTDHYLGICLILDF